MIDEAALDRAIREFPRLVRMVKLMGIDHSYARHRINCAKLTIIVAYHRQRAEGDRG